MYTQHTASHPVDRYAGPFAIAGAVTIVAYTLAAGRGDPEMMALGVLGAILFLTPFALMAPKLPHDRMYRSAMGLALATTFVFFWAIGAVGFMGTDAEHPADVMYVAVPLVGLVGATIGRFQPHGMAWAMLATALTQLIVPSLVLLAGLNLVPISAVELISFTAIVNGPVAALYVCSAWLFGKAARQR